MLRLLLLSVILSILCSCSTELGGGSTDTELGGPVASGIVVDVNGNPVEGASITVVPSNFNSVYDAPLNSNATTLTDINGKFELASDSVGIYSIELYSLVEGSKALYQNIHLEKDTALDTLVIRSTGSITVKLPADIDTTNGKLIIPGTTISQPLYGGIVQNVGLESFVLFDSLPAALINEILYVGDNEIKNLLDSINISSTDTTHTIETIESWEVITNGLPVDTIICSAIDELNQIWIGTAKNGLYKSEGASWKNYDTSMSLGLEALSNRVTALLSDKDNLTWIGTDSGLASIEDSIWKTYSIAAGSIPRSKVKDLCLDNNGDLLVLFSNVVYLHTDTIWYYDSVDVNGIVTDLNSISVDANGIIYVGSNSGLYVLDSWGNSSWREINMDHVQENASKIINQIAIDNNNSVWCATNNAIQVFSNSQWHAYNNNSSGIPEGVVNTICKDNGNQIWTGFQAVDTIARIGLLPKMFTGTDLPMLSGIGSISNITVSENSEIYISTVKGVLIRGSYGLSN